MSTVRPPTPPQPRPRGETPVAALDVAVGAVDVACSAAYAVGHRVVGSMVLPVLRVARPRAVGRRPPPWLRAVAERGTRRRQQVLRDIARTADRTVPWATAQMVGRVDITGLAEQVIASVDLPEIIRESTGAVTSEAVRGVRMRSISADEMLQRAVDRVRPRRDGTPARGPGPP